MAGLVSRALEAISSNAHWDDLHALASDCIGQGSSEAVVALQMLFTANWEWEEKSIALGGLFAFGVPGLQAVTEGAASNPTFKNRVLCAQALVGIAADADASFSVMKFAGYRQYYDGLRNSPAAREAARELLVAFSLAIEDDFDFSSMVASVLQTYIVPGASTKIYAELFGAVAGRWSAVGEPVLRTYEGLIESSPDNEPIFQEFFVQHPQLLDPMAVEVWPQPDLKGFKEPDYVVRRSDGTFLVIEIEKPSKLIMSRKGALSADAAEAQRQAGEYVNYLVQNYSEAEKHFPGFGMPEGLVVIGLERKLTEPQRKNLSILNRDRPTMRIVGFDWIAARARTIAANAAWHGKPKISEARMV